MSLITDTFRSLASIGKVLLLSKWSGALQIKTTLPPQRCIIIGNGPSASESMDKFSILVQSYDLVCVNSFVVSEYFNRIQPKFYILAAPIFFHPDHEISTQYIALRRNVFEALATNTQHKMFLMVPFIAKKSADFRQLLTRNANLYPVYFNLTPVEGFTFLTRILFSLKLGMPRPHNVLIPAIMNMLLIGYKEIYLVGADHSWLSEITVNEQNESLVNQKHFYDENETKPQKMQDFIYRPRRLHEIIHKFYLSFKGYWEIAEYATSQRVGIFNASEYSMIDAFERKKLS